MKRLISSLLVLCLLLSVVTAVMVSTGAVTNQRKDKGTAAATLGYYPYESEPTECPTEPATEAPYCYHWDTYTQNENYRYTGWRYVYDEVTYCSTCGEELYRNSISVPIEPVPTEPEPTEPATEAPCYHWDTYTQNENYHYYSGGCSYDVVTYCSYCGEELYRGYGEERYSQGGGSSYSGGSGTIYFDAASAGWSGASAISFYIYEYGGSNVTEWGAKNRSLTNHNGDTWSFDAAGAGVLGGKEYGIIFLNLDTTAQTADLLFNTSCYGDTAYVPNPDDMLENTVDSNKKSMVARWKNTSSCGPILGITSIGNIVGESIPANTTAYQMFVDFLAGKNYGGLRTALNYNGKDAQTTIDDVAAKLGLDQDDVAKAIREAATTGNQYGDRTDWSRDWSAGRSTLPAGTTSGDSGSSSSGSSSSSSGSTYTSYPRVSVSSAEDGLEISWTRVYGANWYRVFYKSSSGWKKLTDTTGTAAIDTDVRSGKTYTYTVRALSNDRKVYISDYERNGVAGTYIAAPAFSVSNAADGVRVKWDAVSGAAKYRVFYKSKSGWKKLTDTASTSVIDTDVRSGATYTYTVRCLSSDGSRYTSSFRDGKSVTYLTAPDFSVSNAADGVRVKWNAVPGAAKYRVFYNTKNGWKKLTDTASTSVIDTDVRSGSTYTYTVRCINSSGTGYTSAYRDGKKATYLTAPVFSVSNAADGVRIKWNAVPGAAKYRVFYNTRNGWKKLTDTASTSVIDTDVRSGSTYTYTVRCINAGGTGYTSDYRSGKSATFLIAPKFSVSNAGNGVRISWSAVTGAAKYRVFYKSSSGWKKLTDTDSTAVIDADVRSGATYTYTVRCISADGSRYTSDFRDGQSVKYTPAG